MTSRNLRRRLGSWYVFVLVVPILGLTGLTGCARRDATVELRPTARPALSAAEADARADVVRRDPVAYLRTVYENCRRLEHYELLFTRQERRGLLSRLQDPEHIRCRFRRQPFSVRMQWLDENSTYRESSYIENQFDGRMRFVTRRWVPPLLPPPAVNRVDVNLPVTFGESRRPISDFGLEAMMARTLNSLREAGAAVLVSYQGLEELPGGGPLMHLIRIEYPPDAKRTPIHELFIDVRTDLPAGSVFRLATGEIDAGYFYRELNADVRWKDADFLLPEEREAAEPRPAGAS